MRAHLNRLEEGDYFAILAYLAMNQTHRDALQAMRHLVRDRKRVATSLGFGPRFLHSTGQAYKGGPNSGVFLQITCDDATDIPVPGQRYSFGVVKAAEARGDFAVLVERERRALRVHLGADVTRWIERAPRGGGTRAWKNDMTDSPATRDTPRDVRLVVADVDGTLLTPGKVLTPRARAAVHAVIEAGIAFTITSGRPPRGMKILIDALPLKHPISAFNGGLFVRPDLSVMRERLIPFEVVPPVIDTLTRGGLDVWMYTNTDWRVRSRHGSHVDREEWTVKFPPRVVPAFSDALDRVVKIVGVSDDA